MNERDAARLLSGRNRASVLEKEAAFEQVMVRMPPPRRSPVRLWLGGFAALASAAAVLLVVLQRPADDTLVARGGASFGFSTTCLAPDAKVRCVVGGKLVFDVKADPAMFFAAFARGDDGRIVWYWPLSGQRSVSVRALADGQAGAHAFVLGAEQPAGRYTVHGVLSATPLDRAAIKRALGDDLRGRDGVQVITQTLQIEAAP